MLRKRNPATDDKELLELVERTLLPYTRKHFLDAAVSLAELKSRFRRAKVLVAASKQKPERPRGFIAFRTVGSHLWIDMLSVHERYRGRGLGAKLMEAAFMTGKREGCDTAYLYVNWGNEGASRFYRKLGFAGLSRNLKLRCDLYGKPLD